MPNDPCSPREAADELISLLMEITSGTRQAPPSGRLRPLLVGRPHPRRLLPRWACSGVVRVKVRRWCSEH
jgi:hypothetical protein